MSKKKMASGRDFGHARVHIELKFSAEESQNGHKPQYDNFARFFANYAAAGATYTRVQESPLAFDAVVTLKQLRELQTRPYIASVEPKSSETTTHSSRRTLHRARIRDHVPDLYDRMDD